MMRIVKKISRKLADWGELAMGHPRRIAYDLRCGRKVKITPGNAPLQSNMAVIMIYQPEGLLNSFILQLEHMKAKGISPVVVANHEIGATDRDRLKPLVEAFIERPNVGYDFGGYRDGILYLQRLGIQLENLFVLNDSIWFPLNEGSTLIDNALHSEADLFGVFYNDKSKSTPIHYLESYFYRFGRNALSSARFWTYWKKMPIFESKRLVVKRFEFRLTPDFKSMGFTIGSVYQADNVQAALEEIAGEEALEIAQYYCDPFFQASKKLRPIVDANALERVPLSELQDILRNSGLKYFFIDAHPAVLMRGLMPPVIKKNRALRFQKQREIMVR